MTTDLIARIESAGPEEQEKLLWEAFRRLDREAPPARYNRFKTLHDAEAYVDAAMMLMPKGDDITYLMVCMQDGSGVSTVFTKSDPLGAKAFASTPALALLAAILKAGGRDGSQ